MMRLIGALLMVAAVVKAGVLRHRIADDLPSKEEFASAFQQMKDMKLSELADALRRSEAVKNSYRRAAMDLRKNEGFVRMASHLVTNPKVHQVVRNLIDEADNLFVRDLTNLRQSTSPRFQASVRSALDSMKADKGSRRLATHLKQAWDSESVEDQLKHLNMALDVLDSSSDSDSSASQNDSSSNSTSDSSSGSSSNSSLDSSASQNDTVSDSASNSTSDSSSGSSSNSSLDSSSNSTSNSSSSQSDAVSDESGVDAEDEDDVEENGLTDFDDDDDDENEDDDDSDEYNDFLKKALKAALQKAMKKALKKAEEKQ